MFGFPKWLGFGARPSLGGAPDGAAAGGKQQQDEGGENAENGKLCKELDTVSAWIFEAILDEASINHEVIMSFLANDIENVKHFPKKHQVRLFLRMLDDFGEQGSADVQHVVMMKLPSHWLRRMMSSSPSRLRPTEDTSLP